MARLNLKTPPPQPMQTGGQPTVPGEEIPGTPTEEDVSIALGQLPAAQQQQLFTQ